MDYPPRLLRRAEILRGRGIDLGNGAADGAFRIGTWRLSRNENGGAFAVCDKGWRELDCREDSPDPVPVREIWRFFTGKEMPARRYGTTVLLP